VLDLEQLAAHRGSVLGNLPTGPQPTQKAFESSIWQTLRRFRPDQVVFVESESKKIGNLRIPDALMEKMRASACLSVTLSKANRVRLLMEDYAHFVNDPAMLNSQLDCLIPLYGHQKIARWQAMSLANDMHELVTELLSDHYDPAYARSINRNFSQFASARQLELDDISEQAFSIAAHQLHQPIIKLH
jgi:tRNA 2-selenouridine synthase